MSRNLTTSSCCGNIVRLSDIRGKPIEFRGTKPYPPHIGTRWDCPTCETAYFVIWRRNENSHGEGNFVLDLSYYESYNDEHVYDPEEMRAILAGEQPPWCLVADDCEEHQWVW